MICSVALKAGQPIDATPRVMRLHVDSSMKGERKVGFAFRRVEVGAGPSGKSSGVLGGDGGGERWSNGRSGELVWVWVCALGCPFVAWKAGNWEREWISKD